VPRDMEQDPSLAAGLSDEEAQLLAGCAKGRVTIKPWEKAGPATRHRPAERPHPGSAVDGLGADEID
jgi:hypothetical protein